MTPNDTKKHWYTESTIPPIDYVPHHPAPTPRKYVMRGIKRGVVAGVTGAIAIGVMFLFPFALVAIVVLAAFWWLFCRLFAR